MTKLKAFLKSVFDSPYLDKADVAYVITAAVVLFKLHLPADKQAALVGLLGVAYVVAHKVTNALTTKP
jgi:recombinational DNA repair protein RecT